MKKLLFLLSCLISIPVFSQEFTEKPITSEVKEVTVFIEGCQIVREKSVDLLQGNYVLKFTGLSPFLDPKSIQVKTDGDLTILAVNHQQNYLNAKEKNNEKDENLSKIEGINKKIQIEQAKRDVLNDELSFLTENIKIGGTAQTVGVQQLRDAYAFFNEKSTDVRLKIIEKENIIQDLEKERSKYYSQLNSGSGKKEYPQSEVLVKVENKRTGKFTFELSYLASNAGWLPTYDIVAKSIEDPIRLVYKANIRQDTKEDWKNVKLRLSSANPNRSGVATKLVPYNIYYGWQPHIYGQTVQGGTILGNDNKVTGQITDGRSGETLPMASVIIKGSTIGVTTDMDGRYNLTLPNQSSPIILVFSFDGYTTLEVPLNNRRVVNASLQPSAEVLESAIVMGYGSAKGPKSFVGEVSHVVPGVLAGKQKSIATVAPVATNQVSRQTTVDFEIKTPYSIVSDGKSYTVAVDEYNMPAMFEYYCAPKAEKDVFLTASLTNWEKYNLLEGEANIFFENTYTGKTIIDTRNTSDTLTISLGRDKGVSVSRELQKNYKSKNFMGSKKEESRYWKITVRNNKSSAINLQLVDQVPISQSEDIEVKQQNISGAQLNKDTGELLWKLVLTPKQSKELELQYSVKYPSSRNLLIE